MGIGGLAQAEALDFQVAKTNLPSFGKLGFEEGSQSSKTIDKVQRGKATCCQESGSGEFRQENCRN